MAPTLRNMCLGSYFQFVRRCGAAMTVVGYHP